MGCAAVPTPCVVRPTENGPNALIYKAFAAVSLFGRHRCCTRGVGLAEGGESGCGSEFRPSYPF